MFTDKPDNVSLVANTTENTNCSDILWVNFTCEASDAVPPVESYQLLKNEETQDTRNDGTWIRKISEAKDHVYGCRALHFLGNVTADNVTVTFSGGFNLQDRKKNINSIASEKKYHVLTFPFHFQEVKFYFFSLFHCQTHVQ